MDNEPTYYYKAVTPEGKISTCFADKSYARAAEYISKYFPDKELSVSCIYEWPETAWLEMILEAWGQTKYMKKPLSDCFAFVNEFKAKLWDEQISKEEILDAYDKYLDIVGPKDSSLFDICCILKKRGFR